MRVGVVCPYDLGKPGGVQAQVLGLASALEEAGDEAIVIGPGLPQGTPGVDLGPTSDLRGNRSVVPIVIDPRVGKRVRAAAAGVDVLHVHEPLMPFASLTALRAGPPVVATFHADPGSMGRRLYKALGSQVGRLLGDNVRRVTAVSATAAAPLPHDLGVEIVPNGLDAGAFRVDVARLDRRVSFLGRDEPRKGLEVLLEAWPDVVGRLPDAELVVMGAKRRREGITWMGRVDDATKARVLASSAVFAAPNLGGESFGIVVVEAMAAGTPVVASDLPAFRDVGGDVPIYVVPGNPAGLAETIVALLEDPGKRSSMSSEGIVTARRFDWPEVASAYRAIYRSAVS